MIRYPLRVNHPEHTEYIPDQLALLAQFDSWFGSKVIGVIRKSPNRGLYCDATGVMVGDGTLWIAATGDPARPTPRIIALNLP